MEIFTLLACDICLQPNSDTIIVRVRMPKNKRAMGNMQFTMVKHRQLHAWLSWLLLDVPAHSRILDGGRDALVRVFKECLQILHLSSVGFVLAGLHAGGATAHFQEHENQGKLQYAGRWRCEQSMQHYIKESMAAFIGLSLSSEAQAAIDLAHNVFGALDGPPPVRWQTFGARRRLSTRSAH